MQTARELSAFMCHSSSGNGTKFTGAANAAGSFVFELEPRRIPGENFLGPEQRHDGGNSSFLRPEFASRSRTLAALAAGHE